MLWVKAVIVAVSTAVGVGTVYLLKMPKDNPIEEVCETVIKAETGLDVDLSPGTPEVKSEDIALDKKNEEEKKS